METPINPLDNGSRGSRVRVKQEEGVDQTEMVKCEEPRKGSLENTGKKRGKQSEAESDSSEELGLAKSKGQKHQNWSSSSLECSSLKHTSGSSTQQDRMLEVDEEDTEISTDD